VVTELKIVSGDPALDLVNTVGDDRVPDPLEDYESFAEWAARVGVIDDATARRLAARGRERPARAGRALAEARELRAVMDAVFRPLATAPDGPPATAGGSSSASGSGPAQDALARLVALAGAAIERGRLVPTDAGFRLAWAGDHLERPLWPLAAAAVDLLRSGPLDRLKACEDCPWLFLDTSRNRSRRWCSMDDCGSRSKMRRYRARRATAGR
jgi:predicted RNA-binding Zn ribbon-like protein